MTESFEKEDTCIGIYRKSLLYLIRGALEEEPRAEILGLQECLKRDKALDVLLGKPGSGGKGEVMWSQTVGGGPRTSSQSTTHGGFDNDAATMNSLARRVIDNDRLTAGFGTVPGDPGSGRGGVALALRGGRARLHRLAADVEAGAQRQAGTVHRHRRVPSADDRLGGCVADAQAWKQELEHAGFAVDILDGRGRHPRRTSSRASRT